MSDSADDVAKARPRAPKLTAADVHKRVSWFDVLIELGVPDSMLANENAECPMCTKPRSFTFHDATFHGDWTCRKCGEGDGVDLLQRTFVWSFAFALSEVIRVAKLEPERVPVAPTVQKRCRRCDGEGCKWCKR